MNNLSKMIDHTLLKATATTNEIEKLCDEALEHNFASVCINPMYITLATKKLKNSDIGICTVVGFPLGASQTSVKALETQHAIDSGATEIDMVVPIGFIKSKKYDKVRYDIEQIVRICHSKNVLIKTILETCYLSDEEIHAMVEICNEYETDFIKTSTGFGTHGATIEHVKLIASLCNKHIKIKASGGIRTYEEAQQMILAGASRLGTSNSIEIITKQ